MRICPKCKSTYEEATQCPEDDFRTIELEATEAGGEDPRIGTVFEDRYRVEERLGEGGFGVVYLGTHLRIDRRVAIKVLDPHRPGDFEYQARFQREARLLGSLSHPNIVDVYDFGETEQGECFLVMDHLDGESLGQRLDREGPIDPELAHQWACDVLSALAAAHAEDIVHRDLKPENIFLTPVDGQRDTVHLLDFGISKVVSDAETEVSLTQTGLTLGSPHYMSPEQVEDADIGAPSDLYSFGCTFYEVLTGDKPFADKGKRVALMLAICKEEPAPPTLGGHPMRGPFVDAIMECLAKDPEDRPESAEALHERLSALEPPVAEVTNEPLNLKSDHADTRETPPPALLGETRPDDARRASNDDEISTEFEKTAVSDEEVGGEPHDGETSFLARRTMGFAAGVVTVGLLTGAALQMFWGGGWASEGARALASDAGTLDAGSEDRRMASSDTRPERDGSEALEDTASPADVGGSSGSDEPPFLKQAGMRPNAPDQRDDSAERDDPDRKDEQAGTARSPSSTTGSPSPEPPQPSSSPPETLDATSEPPSSGSSSPDATSGASAVSDVTPPRTLDAAAVTSDASPPESTSDDEESPNVDPATASGASESSETTAEEASAGASKVLDEVRTQFTMGHRSRAEQRCQRARNEGHSACLRLLGALYQTVAGDRSEACRFYQSYLETDPADAERIESTLDDLNCP